ncbi:hypothetical protein [Ensifer sp. MJa1]|uniref:hypothetical protein n=1 Tax=Ensifer sp. MJa1 TaxID=2919888 RepID=UPI003008B488
MDEKSTAKLRAAFLKAASDLGDTETVYRLAILILRSYRDPELRLLARILSRKAKTGVTVHFSRRQGRQTGPSTPVRCRDGPTSRREIARAAYDLLGKPEEGEKIERGRMKEAVGKVAARHGITDKIVRDCYHQHRRSLAQEEAFRSLLNERDG